MSLWVSSKRLNRIRPEQKPRICLCSGPPLDQGRGHLVLALQPDYSPHGPLTLTQAGPIQRHW